MKNISAILCIIILLCLSPILFSATTDHEPDFACSYSGSDFSNSIRLSSPDEYINRDITAIVNIVGLKKNFDIYSADVDNAAAVSYGSKRYILYNPEFMEVVYRSTANRWTAVSILAHEIGHHLNGHLLTEISNRPSIELEADEFSGFVLCKLGASLSEAQAAMRVIGADHTSRTHPSRTLRLKAIADGWNKAASQMKGDYVYEPSIIAPKPSAEKKSPVVSTSVVLDQKFVKANVRLDQDKTNPYYITVRNHFVTIKNNQLVVLGSLIENDNKNYPFVLSVNNGNDYLFVATDGNLYYSNGKAAGRII